MKLELFRKAFFRKSKGNASELSRRFLIRNAYELIR